MTTFKQGWYLLYTRPKHERKVLLQLEEQQLRVYLPTHHMVRNWSGRNKIITVPLFPSYIFIYVKNLKDYFNGLGANGVLRYVKFGKEVARIDSKVVSDLQLMLEHVEDVEVTFADFQPGQMVTITEGALTGLTCEVVQYHKKERIIVRVGLLRRNILMEMPVAHLITI